MTENIADAGAHDVATSPAAAQSFWPKRIAGAPALAAALTVFLCLMQAAVALALCHGAFTYSLDDPYITLSLARHITEGTYGINAGESASPSSSILYPLILAPFAALHAELYIPLLLNTAAAGFAGGIFAILIQDAAPCASNRRIAFLAVVLSLVSGVIAVPLVGLEHGLHAALTAAAFLGLVRTLETGRAPAWMVPVLVALPLVRFEGLALEGLIVLALLIHRQWKAAAITSVVTGCALLGWAAAMHALGLPLLPSSVLVKLASQPHVRGDLAAYLSARLAVSPHYSLGGVLQFIAFAIVIYPVTRMTGLLKGPRPIGIEATISIVAVGALIAHVLFAGREARYDIYIHTLAWCAITWLWGPCLPRMAASRARLAAFAMLPLIMEIGMVMWSLLGPIGSRAILEQQAQLRRLAVEFYRGPVAVNDLGLVSYGNPYHVLDLWGLGSEEARIARMNHRRDWMQGLTAEHHVGMAAIYSDWFAGQVPRSWTLIGTLTNRHGQGFDGDLSVDVYATTPEAAPAVRAALTQLKSAAADLSAIEVRPGR